MFVSSIIATSALIGTLVLVLVVAVLLAYVDHRCDKGREH